MIVRKHHKGREAGGSRTPRDPIVLGDEGKGYKRGKGNKET